jgi:hypothetical protein
MARFVHITAWRNAAAVRRSGLRPRRFKGGLREPGVYATPVLARYEVTHQWAREIKRWGGRSLAAATFVVPDDEPVLVGRYGRALDEVSAAEAVGLIHGLEDARGWQVVIPRAVTAGELVHVRPLRRVTGWRYFPDAHGQAPCGCPACSPRGEPFARKIRAAYGAREGGQSVAPRSGRRSSAKRRAKTRS